MNFSTINNYLIILFLILCFLPVEVETVSAQTYSDTLWSELEVESGLYEINLLKFKRLLLKKQVSLSDSAFNNQVETLRTQFIKLAEQQNYFEANIILESTIDLISNSSEWPYIDEELLSFDIEFDAAPEPQSNFAWMREVSVGGDQWKQEFEMSIPEYDSTITEEYGNPLVAFRLGFDYDQPNYCFKLDGNFKNSRDYISGELELDFKKKLSENANLIFEDHLESTTYKQTIDLTYWQNEILAELRLKNRKNFFLNLKNTTLIRKNRPESSCYTNYWQNQFRIDGNYSGGRRLFLSGEYEWENCYYPVYLYKDYQEHQFGLNYYGMFSLNYNMHFDIKYRLRNYTAAFNDTTYYNDYDELYTDFSCTYRLNNRFALKLENMTESRKYARMNQVTIDYLDFEIEPAVVFYLTELWTIELGYVYSFQNYKQPGADETGTVDEAGNITETLYEEDCYSTGISLTLDIFQLNKFMFSITDIYSKKRYPHSAANEIDAFTLYTDRNTNSLLCYFSWSITKNWELGLIANYDSDRDPHQKNSDTRSTMFSVELTFMF